MERKGMEEDEFRESWPLGLWVAFSLYRERGEKRESLGFLQIGRAHV